MPVVVCGSQEEQELLKKYHYWQTEQCDIHSFVHCCAHASARKKNCGRPALRNIRWTEQKCCDMLPETVYSLIARNLDPLKGRRDEVDAQLQTTSKTKQQSELRAQDISQELQVQAAACCRASG